MHQYLDSEEQKTGGDDDEDGANNSMDAGERERERKKKEREKERERKADQQCTRNPYPPQVQKGYLPWKVLRPLVTPVINCYDTLCYI